MENERREMERQTDNKDNDQSVNTQIFVCGEKQSLKVIKDKQTQLTVSVVFHKLSKDQIGAFRVLGALKWPSIKV
jgi:hypothetical protein